MSKNFSISQNFLTSTKTIKRLIGLTNITKKDDVIEIGAGKGHITRELAKVCQSVEAYEIDMFSGYVFSEVIIIYFRINMRRVSRYDKIKFYTLRFFAYNRQKNLTYSDELTRQKG